MGTVYRKQSKELSSTEGKVTKQSSNISKQCCRWHHDKLTKLLNGFVMKFSPEVRVIFKVLWIFVREDVSTAVETADEKPMSNID